jgi:glycosyltransferase involved in cell wall biosynthesis
VSERPLVSIITPTWQRPDLMRGCIENVRAQSYRPLEHVIISDGPERETARVALAALDCADVADVRVRYVPLGQLVDVPARLVLHSAAHGRHAGSVPATTRCGWLTTSG